MSREPHPSAETWDLLDVAVAPQLAEAGFDLTFERSEGQRQVRIQVNSGGAWKET